MGPYAVKIDVKTIFPDGESRQDVSIVQRGFEYDELLAFQLGLTSALTGFFTATGQAALESKKLGRK